MKVVLAMFLIQVSALAQAADKHPFFEKPLLLGAHRGGGLVWPEHTVLALQEAAKLSPDILLEVDARLTKDGQVVLMHDKTVERTTEGTGPVEALTFTQARELDAGYDFTTDGGTTYPFRGKGLEIASLKEALEAAPNHRFLVEFKTPDTVIPVVKVVRAAGAEQRVLFASFNAKAMQALVAEMPDALRCFDMTNSMNLLRALRGGDWEAYQPEAPVVSVPTEMVTQVSLTDDEIKKIRAKGLLFQIHTLNTEREIRTWLAKGVDSILSDDAKLLHRILEEKQ